MRNGRTARIGRGKRRASKRRTQRKREGHNNRLPLLLSHANGHIGDQKRLTARQKNGLFAAPELNPLVGMDVLEVHDASLVLRERNSFDQHAQNVHRGGDLLCGDAARKRREQLAHVHEGKRFWLQRGGSDDGVRQDAELRFAAPMKALHVVTRADPKRRRVGKHALAAHEQRASVGDELHTCDGDRGVAAQTGHSLHAQCTFAAHVLLLQLDELRADVDHLDLQRAALRRVGLRERGEQTAVLGGRGQEEERGLERRVWETQADGLEQGLEEGEGKRKKRERRQLQRQGKRL